MSFLNRMTACNYFDSKHAYPFIVSGQLVGWIKRSHWLSLSQWSKLFLFDGNRVTLSPALKTFEARTKAFKDVVETLRQKDLVSQWRSEMYGVSSAFEQCPLVLLLNAPSRRFLAFVRMERTLMDMFEMERGCLSGWRNGVMIWLLRRADWIIWRQVAYRSIHHPKTISVEKRGRRRGFLQR